MLRQRANRQLEFKYQVKMVQAVQAADHTEAGADQVVCPVHPLVEVTKAVHLQGRATKVVLLQVQIRVGTNPSCSVTISHYIILTHPKRERKELPI